MAKGMTTCKVCGRDFALMAEEHYVVREFGKKGLVEALSAKEPMQYDAFDCPHCGCQNVMQVRMIDVEEFTDTEEHDLCDGCEYEDCKADEEPCKECRQNYMDKYKKKEEN